MKPLSEFQVEQRRLRVSNLDKVLYPSVDFTKAAVIDYYVRIAPFLLPHLKGRPLTLRRFPEGVRGEAFFAKNCPTWRPTWLPVVPRWSAHKQGVTNFCLVNDLPSLVWVANLASLELHPSLSLASDIERPTVVAFDLDPGPPADLRACGRVALLLRSMLSGLDLKAFAKTSGAKGLQVYVPLNTPVTYDDTKEFARTLAEMLERRAPDLVLSNMKKSLRAGKVFVDWSQNDSHKTTVSVYSLRARERPTVSTPVAWSEIERVDKGAAADRLVFDASQVLDRVNRRGDLFAPVLSLKQRLRLLH
jgi:bifunctional non-homologous end joining protein LigD